MVPRGSGLFLLLAFWLVAPAFGQIIVPLPIPPEIKGGKLGRAKQKVVTITSNGVAGIYQRMASDGAMKPLLSSIAAGVGTEDVGRFFPGTKAFYFFTSKNETWKIDYSSGRLERILGGGDVIDFRLFEEQKTRRGTVKAFLSVFPSLDGSRELAQCFLAQAATPPNPTMYFTGVFERKKNPPQGLFDTGVVFDQFAPLRTPAVGLFMGEVVLLDPQGRVVYTDWGTLGNGFATDDRYLVRYDPQSTSSEVLIRKSSSFLKEPVYWWTLFPDLNTYDLYLWHDTTTRQKLVKLEAHPVEILTNDKEVGNLGRPLGIYSVNANRTLGLIALRFKSPLRPWTLPVTPTPVETLFGIPDTLVFWDPQGNSITPLAQIGDVMPDGKRLDHFIGLDDGADIFWSVSDCEGDFLTVNDNGTIAGWYRVLRACIMQAPASAFAAEEITLQGKNLLPTGLPGVPTTEVLIDGAAVSSNSVTVVSDAKVGVKTPAALGPHSFHVRVTYGGRTSVSNTVSVNVVPPPPPPVAPVAISAITSLMGELKPSFALNEVITIWGKGMSLKAQAWDGTFPQTSELGCRVTISSLFASSTASLYYCSDIQVNAVVPMNIPVGRYSLIVERMASNGSVEARNQPAEITITATSPTLLGNSVYPIYLQNITQDPSGNTFVSGETPARTGDVLIIYATGLGITDPLLSKGMATTARVLARVEVLVQGHAMELLGAASSPQFPGLYQIAFRIQEDTRPNESGSASLEVKVDGKAVKSIYFNLT